MKAIRKVFLVFLVIIYLVLGVGAMHSSWVVDTNTRNLEIDLNKVKVKNISVDDKITLEENKIVESGKIVNFIKVEKGSGTWYVEDSNSLVVEITYKDYIKMYSLFIIIAISLIWISRKRVIGILFILGYLFVCILLF